MNRRTGSLSAALVMVLGGAASAQPGAWGWGGWGAPIGGSTIAGDALMGGGVFASGMGQFNLDTAQANSINVDTVTRANEYMYQSIQIANQNYFNRVAAQRARRTASLAEMEESHLRNPTQGNVVNGNALNAILRQFENPTVPTSLVASLGTDLTIPGSAVRTIPLTFAKQGIVISLDRLAANGNWPLPLMAEEYTALRDQYRALVEEVKAIPDSEPIPDAKIVEGIRIMSEIRAKANASLTGQQFGEAERFLKGNVGMLQMARQPDIKDVLRQASNFESITVANLLTFMEVFNLQFGVARSPAERALYTQALYPKMRELRDRAERELRGQILTATQQIRDLQPHQRPTEVFEGFDWERIASTAPPPPVTLPAAPAPAPSPAPSGDPAPPVPGQ